jgi:hypothetical protein
MRDHIQKMGKAKRDGGMAQIIDHLFANRCPEFKTPTTTPEKKARCQWLMPVILATQEAEIRRSAVEASTMQLDYDTLSWKNLPQKKGWQSGSSGKSACLASMRP